MAKSRKQDDFVDVLANPDHGVAVLDAPESKPEGPVGKPGQFAVSLPQQPRDIFDAVDEADAIRQYDAKNGILGSDHPHTVEAVS